MRRVLAAGGLLLALTACASPQADLQDQVTAVTEAANAGDVEDLLAEAQTLESLVDRLEASDDLTAAEATRLRNAAVALQQRAGQVRQATPVPSPIEVPTEEPTTPEPEVTTPEPEETTPPPPPPTTEAPEPTPEPEQTEDGGVLPLPTQDAPEETTDPEAAVTASPASDTPPGDARSSAGTARGGEPVPTEQPA